VAPSPDDAPGTVDPRDYDVDHYARVLRDNFAVRLSRALAPDDFAAVFASPDQLSLFAPSTATMRPVLDTRAGATIIEPLVPDEAALEAPEPVDDD
jgi:DNA polymerase I